MAIPSSYSEETFKTYLDGELGPVADALGWTTGNGDFDEAVNDALVLYGTDDITNVSGRGNVDRLRQFGKLAIWRRVMEQTAGDYAFSADGASYSREQVHAQAAGMVSKLETRLAAWLPEYAVDTQKVEMQHDPYVDREYTERLL